MPWQHALDINLCKKGKGCHTPYRDVGRVLICLSEAIEPCTGGYTTESVTRRGQCDAKPAVTFPAT